MSRDVTFFESLSFFLLVEPFFRGSLLWVNSCPQSHYQCQLPYIILMVDGGKLENDGKGDSKEGEKELKYYS